LKFKSVQKGVSVYVNGGSDFTNSSTMLEAKNSTVKIDVEYKLKASEYFIIVAVPDKNNYETKYEFEYWTDAEKYPWYELTYYEWFKKHHYGPTVEIMVIACLGLIMLLCLVAICCCIKNCLNRNKVK